MIYRVCVTSVNPRAVEGEKGWQIASRVCGFEVVGDHTPRAIIGADAGQVESSSELTAGRGRPLADHDGGLGRG